MSAATNRKNDRSDVMTDCILILEDDPFIAEDMAWAIEHKLGVTPVIASSNREAFAWIAKGIGFAFLDLHVADGTSVSVADTLKALNLPFAFVSGSEKLELPNRLQRETFIRKPASTDTLVSVIANASQCQEQNNDPPVP